MNALDRRFHLTLFALAMSGLSGAASANSADCGKFLLPTFDHCPFSLNTGIAANAKGDFVAAYWRNAAIGPGQIKLERNLDGVETLEESKDFFWPEADIAMLPDGRHVLVGLSRTKEVIARPYRPDATAVLARVRADVDASATLSNEHVRVAMARTGTFVVVWAGPDADRRGVYARRFTLAGVPIGQPFAVSTSSEGDQSSPEIAMAKDGHFVVAWMGSDADGTGIRTQVFDAADQRVGVEAAVNAGTTGDQERPSVAMDVDGNFFVAWTGPRADGRPGTWLRRFGPEGVAETDDIPVLAGVQANVVVDLDGDVLVSSAEADYPDTERYSGGDLIVRRFSNAGASKGRSILTHAAFRPDLALDADGDFIVGYTDGYTFSYDSFHHGATVIAGAGSADLAVKLRKAPRFIAPGSDVKLQFKVSNETRPRTKTGNPTIDAGIGMANLVVVRSVSLSPAVLGGNLQALNPGWTCVTASGGFSCRYRGHLPAGGSVPLIVPATMPSTPGALEFPIDVSSTAERDRRPLNNSLVTRLQVGED